MFFYPQCTDSIREQCFKHKGEAEYKYDKLYKDRDEFNRWKEHYQIEFEDWLSQMFEDAETD